MFIDKIYLTEFNRMLDLIKIIHIEAFIKVIYFAQTLISLESRILLCKTQFEMFQDKKP